MTLIKYFDLIICTITVFMALAVLLNYLFNKSKKESIKVGDHVIYKGIQCLVEKDFGRTVQIKFYSRDTLTNEFEEITQRVDRKLCTKNLPH